MCKITITEANELVFNVNKADLIRVASHLPYLLGQVEAGEMDVFQKISQLGNELSGYANALICLRDVGFIMSQQERELEWQLRETHKEFDISKESLATETQVPISELRKVRKQASEYRKELQSLKEEIRERNASK